MSGATWASTSSPGGRPDNQDDYGEAEAGGARAFVVADGLGGHVGGAIASKTAVGAILERFQADPSIDADALGKQFRAAQEALRKLQREDPELTGCRTTAVVLLERDRRALWGHVGDTRLYHLRGGHVVAQTLDHSVPQALVQAGEIDAEAIRQHPDRNRLLRALGGDDEGDPTVPDAELVLEPGDAFLLCTDGFWDWVREDDMEATLVGSETPGVWLERMEALLLERAEGVYDNYTATAVLVERAPRARAGRAVRVVVGAAAFGIALLWMLRSVCA